MGKGAYGKSMRQQNMSKPSLVIASGNLGKVREFRKLLMDLPVTILSQPEGLQIEESGKTFVENARLKALAVAKATGQWAMADDSGLSVDALDGAPGVYSARYANTDEERICRLLEDLEPFADRSAHFSSAICVASPEEEILLEVEGKCEGLIIEEPRGINGFGYDPIFEVYGTGLTFAEMEIENKQMFSHRGKAFALLRPELEKLLRA